MTMASDGKALTGLWFDGQKHFAATLSQKREERRLPVFGQTIMWLDGYFGGKRQEQTPTIAMKTTPFRKVVWEILPTIPYGKTMTYGEVARLVAEKTGLKKCPRARLQVKSNCFLISGQSV